MKKLLTSLLCLAMLGTPAIAKDKKKENKKQSTTVTKVADLRPNFCYTIETGDVDWTISDDTTHLVSLKATKQKKDKKDKKDKKKKKNTLQQFSILSTNGRTFYLYSVGAKAFIEWITSDEADELIAKYGEEEYGQALFTVIAE